MTDKLRLISLWHFKLNRLMPEFNMKIEDHDGLIIAETFEDAQKKIMIHIKETYYTPEEYTIKSLVFREEVII